MSYQLREITIPNQLRFASASNPLIVEIGAITGNDATTLTVSVVVSAVSGIPAETAAITLQESWNGGSTWTNVPGISADTITGLGTFKARVTSSSGVISPQLRMVITPTGAGTLYAGKVFCTFSPGQIIPFGAVGAAGSTEATQLLVLAAVDQIEGYVDGLETLIGTTNASLTTIAGYVDQIEGYTDGLEGLIGTTNSTLTTIDGRVDQIEGYVDGLEGLLTTISSNISAPVGVERVAVGTPYVRDYSVSNLATGSWTQILASTAARIRKLDIFDSSGSTVLLATGGAGAEVEVLRITPGGNGAVELTIPVGTRLSIQSPSGVLSVGTLVINMFS
jgi:hypothetical protein